MPYIVLFLTLCGSSMIVSDLYILDARDVNINIAIHAADPHPKTMCFNFFSWLGLYNYETHLFFVYESPHPLNDIDFFYLF